MDNIFSKTKTFLKLNYLYNLIKMRWRMNNKKGLSTVVATLIIILLVLIAVGILWVVLQNVFTQGAATVELSQKCLEVKIDVAGVVQTGVNTGIYDVSLRRNSGGETIGGVKLNFFNGTSNSGILDFTGANLTEL